MNEEELKKLIEGYYDGTGTDEDEKVLRAYFSTHENIEGFATEKEIFGYYLSEEDIPEPSSDFEARIMAAVDDSQGKTRTGKIRKLLLPFISAAAGILILAASWFFFVHRVQETDTFKDPQIAYAETMKILMDVSSRMNHGTSRLKPVGKINDVRVKSFESLNRSADLVQRNLMSLGLLHSAPELKSATKE